MLVSDEVHSEWERLRSYEHRQKAKTARFTDDTGDYDVEESADNTDIEAEVIRRDTMKEIYSVIDTELSETERTIIYDFFFKEKSIADIAQELGLTESNCRQKKSRALNKVKAIITNKTK